MDETALEKRLGSLVKGNSPENRKQHALEAKGKGKKVIGILTSYAPEEVIYAAGMLPWRITGTWDANFSRAMVYRDSDSCRYCTHALEALLRGDLDFLDGIVSSDWDDDRRRIFDVWCHISKPPFAVNGSTPKSKSLVFQKYLAKENSRLASALGNFSGQNVTEENLWQAIKIYNESRRLLTQLYDLRRRAVPAVSGAEVLGITTACMVMDKAYFNTELRDLLPYLEHRQVEHKPGEPRVLVSSDMLDNPRFLEIIEGEGCHVVMDDLDTGSRYFYKLVDEYDSDPSSALARRYCQRPADPVAYNWEEQIKQVIDWVGDYRVEGVIDLYEEWSPARQWRAPLMTRELKRAGIPFVRISRGYEVGAVEQLRTRVSAFLEMLTLKS
jgi:benzoyl-CoA reductase/2-hydroxyglutaryl-CoA dehydratase subunit BcrC/BadD/HgdB